MADFAVSHHLLQEYLLKRYQSLKEGIKPQANGYHRSWKTTPGMTPKTPRSSQSFQITTSFKAWVLPYLLTQKQNGIIVR